MTAPVGARTPLTVWLYDVHIADLTGDHEQLTFIWTAEASARWGVGSRVMSNLLPTGGGGETADPRRVGTFLSGLLAEGELREHMAFEAGLGPNDLFGLIAAYGRDTAGSLVFHPDPSPRPDQIGSWSPVDDHEIATMLRAASTFTPDRLTATSLAGVRPKIALRRHAGEWFRCRDGAPSTHIVKLGHPAGSPPADVIDTETACLALAQAIGLTTVDAHIATFDDLRTIVVSRFDRELDATGGVARIHQEDTAQAVGLNPTELSRKHQGGRGLPSLKAIADVLRRGGEEPDQLLALTTFNLAVGNSGAQAKNIALLRLDDGRTRLAPAYDVAMHAHHHTFDGLFAMDVAGITKMRDIAAEHLIDEALSWPLPPRRARRVVRWALEDLSDALTRIDRELHPGVTAVAWQTVETRTKTLLAQLT
jgi:serine/threonine-protein kinase HipA